MSLAQYDQSFTNNRLLRILSAEDYGLLQPYFTRVEVGRGVVLVAPHEPIGHVHFLEDGIASIVSDLPGTGRTEAGIFGIEGVSATCLLLDTDRTPHKTFMQVAGKSALRIETAPYLAAIAQSDTLRRTLLRYVQTQLVQSAQNTATNASRSVEARLARWLLMCHDRLEGDEIALTHEFIGTMICAERSGVTLCLHVLEGAGAIHSKRARVIVRDRARLKELAGDGYGVAEAEYRHLIGPFGKPLGPCSNAADAHDPASRTPRHLG